MIRKLAVAAALLLCLTACDNATTGTVTSRQHVPQHDELSYFQCVAYDAKSNCAVQIPIYETVAECWKVNFHNDKDDENGSACVDQRDYETYKLGDQFPHPR